jgi:hypothetical protein
LLPWQGDHIARPQLRRSAREEPLELARFQSGAKLRAEVEHKRADSLLGHQ